MGAVFPLLHLSLIIPVILLCAVLIFLHANVFLFNSTLMLIENKTQHSFTL